MNDGHQSHCCRMMADNLTSRCEIHSDRYDCPDALLDRVRDGVGLILHDGSHSVIEIAFCPWCGAKLPGIADMNLA